MRQQLEEQVPHTRGIPSVVIPNFLADVSPVDAEGQLADCISVGSLVERKNHAYLLHVIAEARRLGHTLSLTLVGDGPLRRDLQQLARHLHITDLVTFTGKNYAVEQLLPRHRVYVHSSLMDNCPFALIEAFRAGLPVIAGPVGGIPELLGDTGASRAWDLADPVAGAAVLTSLLSDKFHLDKAASMARSEFETKYCASVAGQQLVRFLNEVADQSRS
jgi:glycosyltransferase involved in cell wall biosynthesis